MTASDLEQYKAATPEFALYEDDIHPNPTSIPDIDDVTPEEYDQYIGAVVNVSLEGTELAGTVKRRARDSNGNLYGKQNDNSILDKQTYKVEFPDGRLAAYSANVIAENMIAQCDPDGNQHLLLESIVDHKSDDTAIKDKDRYITVNNRKHHRKTTN